MDIIVNATSLVPPVTGIGRYTYNLMSALSLISNLRAHYLYNKVLSDNLEYSNNIDVPAVASKRVLKSIIPQSYRVALWRQQRVFNQGVRRFKPDLYHEPNYIAMKFKGPTVVTIHDLSVIRFPETHPKERVKQFENLLPGVVDKADALVVDSEFIRNELIETFSVNPSKVFTTLLGVGKEFQPYDGNAVVATLDTHNLHYKNYLLVVGTLEPRKNLTLILKSYQNLSSKIRERYPLVIVGMRGWKMEQFDAGIKKMVMKGQVRLLGYVTDCELPHIYAGAKAFLFPSIYEGFGLPPLEAMASGVPVIASDQASIPEVVGSAGVLLDTDDVDGWTNAMTCLLEDFELEQQMISQSLQRAKDFTWRRCAEQTLSAYEYALSYPIIN